MFLGLSLFGYGIGNISSYLNYANQAEIELQNNITYFQDLCTIHDIDNRTQNLIICDLEKHFENYGDRELIEKGSMLSNNVLFQLETNLYRDLIKSFSLFEKINMSVIRTIKSSCHIGNKSLILRKNNSINSIYFVTNGKILI